MGKLIVGLIAFALFVLLAANAFSRESIKSGYMVSRFSSAPVGGTGHRSSLGNFTNLKPSTLISRSSGTQFQGGIYHRRGLLKSRFIQSSFGPSLSNPVSSTSSLTSSTLNINTTYRLNRGVSSVNTLSARSAGFSSADLTALERSISVNPDTHLLVISDNHPTKVVFNVFPAPPLSFSPFGFSTGFRFSLSNPFIFRGLLMSPFFFPHRPFSFRPIPPAPSLHLPSTQFNLIR